MKLKLVSLLAGSVLMITANSASASSFGRHHHHPHIAYQHTTSHQLAYRQFGAYRLAGRRFSSGSRAAFRDTAYRGYASQTVGNYTPSAYTPTVHRVADGRPSAWCGWEMRQLVGADPGPEYNLARNWAHWGHAAGGPAPGVVGVMAHHVFKVISVVGPGQVLAISGNDSHAVRTRVRSTGGVIAWRSA
jgi:hypothetical protein